MKIEKYVLFALLLLQCQFGVILDAYETQNQINPKSGAVVFVHGFMRSSMNMKALVCSFSKGGWQTENWCYSSREKFIEGHAEDLVNKLRKISKQHPGKPISFVTHSMGGLIVRAALNHTDCPDEAKMGRAVLIAPPNRGSIFARKLYNYNIFRRILGNKAGEQLMTTAQDGFDKFGNFPNYMPVLIISGIAGCNPLIPGNNDGKVASFETCLKTPHYHESCFAGHSWICYIPSVIKTTKKFLSSTEIPLLK